VIWAKNNVPSGSIITVVPEGGKLPAGIYYLQSRSVDGATAIPVMVQ
jgi:hypothetical protein